MSVFMLDQMANLFSGLTDVAGFWGAVFASVVGGIILAVLTAIFIRKQIQKLSAKATAISNTVVNIGTSDSSLSKPSSLNSDRLPTVKGDFFGRHDELAMLDSAWTGGSTRVIQFIAPGGTGKTKLLRHWIDNRNDIDSLLAWSFYSQGSGEDKQTSSTQFFNFAFKQLGEVRSDFVTPEDQGDHLASLLISQRRLLVLDGLEPMQYASDVVRGQIKDRALKQLLKTLASNNNGLCVITTRLTVHELSGHSEPAVITYDLENLAVDDGVQLLKSFQLSGSQKEFEKAVSDFDGHALALNLLGNAVKRYLNGDLERRDTLPSGESGDPHAFKIMHAYEDWLQNTKELRLLYMLGLFDHPLDESVLWALIEARIGGLTDSTKWWEKLFRSKAKPLTAKEQQAWREAVYRLREAHRLLAQGEQGCELDCHPLIREYFGRQLQQQQPDAWQQAHETLYHYYKALPEKEQPDTLEEMQPLFHAVAHGCAAGLHQQAKDEVYLDRIQRKGTSKNPPILAN